MSNWDCVQGGTVLVPNLDDIKHLHIVLCDPQNLTGYLDRSCLLVSATTIRPKVPYDESCILREGDHEFIKHDSYVYYKQISSAHTEKSILKNINSNIYVPKSPLSIDIMKRVLNGLRESDFVSPWILNDFYFD